MKELNGIKIIGVDNGYGNTKTANHCFKTGILGYDSEPLFTRDMLVYNGRYNLIGEGHKEFLGRKTEDADFYLLTLAAMAMELQDAGLTEADVLIGRPSGRFTMISSKRCSGREPRRFPPRISSSSAAWRRSMCGGFSAGSGNMDTMKTP